MILLARVSALLVCGEVACRLLDPFAPRARPLVRGLALMGALLLPGISAVAPQVLFLRLPSDGSWFVSSPLTSLTLPAVAWMSAAWLVGSIVSAGLVVGAQWRLGQWLRRAVALRDGRLLRMARALARRVGVRRVRFFLRPDSGGMPFAMGVLRPTIVLPREATRWPASRLEAVLIHELEHVRRRDVVARLAAELACCVYWFHPIAHWHASRLRVESELACDEAVLAAGARPSRYASDLLELATQTSWALGFSDRHTLSERVRTILTPAQRGIAPNGWGRGAIAAAACLITIAIACYAPSSAARLSAADAARAEMVLASTSTSGAGRRDVHVTIEAPPGAARGRSRKVVVYSTR
jgi:beta-lactamase regulating signal transducer with metallopeptidase domain